VAPSTAPRTLDDGTVNIVKDQRVALTSAQSGPLTRVMLDLGWVSAPGKGAIDLDASVIAFDSAGEKQCIVWYQHQTEYLGALQHTGDNKGDVEGPEAERVLVELNRLPDTVDSLVFTINSFKGHTFTDLSAAYCSLSDDQGHELIRYDLTDTQPSTAVLMAILHRSGPGEWGARAIGEYHDCRTVRKLVGPASRQAKMR
jgi:stress response protein SCP2